MGRALVREPKAFLLDEPLSNLDAKLRVQMRAELKRLHQRFGVTTIYVTHDQVEAMTLGDRIAVMTGGRLQQLGPPQDVYDHPANVFVAGFIGSPPMNLFAADVRDGSVTAGQLAFTRAGVAERRHDRRGAAGGDARERRGRRPHDRARRGRRAARRRRDRPRDGRRARGRERRRGGGRDAVGGRRRRARAAVSMRDRSGEAGVRVGDEVPVSIDPAKIHLFDATTGDAIRAGS